MKVMIKKWNLPDMNKFKTLLILPLLGPLIFLFSELARGATVLNNSSAIVWSDEKPGQETAVEVPFAVVEEVPVFPGLEELLADEQKNCITDRINSFINKNYNLNLSEKIGLEGPTKVVVRFKINPSGEIVNVEGAGPYPELSAEGVRVVKNLPKILPGKQQGKPVTVLYAVPITLNVPQ